MNNEKTNQQGDSVKFPRILLKNVKPIPAAILYVGTFILLWGFYYYWHEYSVAVDLVVFIGNILIISSMLQFYGSRYSKHRLGDMIAGMLKGVRFIQSFGRYKRTMRVLTALFIMNLVVFPATASLQGSQLVLTDHYTLHIPHLMVLDVLTLVTRLVMVLIIIGIIFVYVNQNIQQQMRFQMVNVVIEEARRLQLHVPVADVPGGPFLQVNILLGSIQERLETEQDEKIKEELSNLLTFVRDNGKKFSQVTLHPEQKHPTLFEYWLVKEGVVEENQVDSSYAV